MTPEPPPRPARRTRPDAAFRRRALGLDASSEGSSATSPRESFRNALSRIPDIERSDDGLPLVVPVAAAPSSTDASESSPAAKVAPTEESPAPEVAPAGAAPGGKQIGTTPTPTPTATAVPTVSGTRVQSPAVVLSPSVPPPPRLADDRHGHRHIAPPPKPPLWRRVGFALALVALVASIPVLGRTGYRLVTESTDGRAGASAAGPDDPGYEELVESTPTALIVQKDAAGLPVNLTFLSLTDSSGGGAVVFVPLDTEVVAPAYGVDRLRTSYTVVADDPSGATKQISFQTAKVLNVGIDETIELDDRSWAQLVGPVAPFPLDNPEPVELPSGTVPSGQTTLDADQMGPYLAARREDEEETAAFYRQQVAFSAWLDAVAASDKPDAVPGETTSGIGLFARSLAKGVVTYSNLPGTYSVADDGGLRFEPDKGEVNDLMVDAAPAPSSPYPGARTRARVLNGVGPGDIPADVLRKVVSLNGSVIVVGNGPSFANDETTIIYSDPKQKDYAQLLKASLGATGELKLDRTAPDNIDVTVILGKDVLGDDPQTRSTGTTATPLTATSTSTSTSTAEGVPAVNPGSGDGADAGTTTTTAPTEGF